MLVAVATLVLAAAAAAGAVRELECVCTSTHFADVSFSVKCQRNTTAQWDTQKRQGGINKFFEHSTVACERGPQSPPRKDYRLVNRLGYYKFHPRQTTWEDALRTCAREGANLVVVNSDAEAAALASIFQEFPKLHEEGWLNDQAWVGVTDLKTEGTFISLTGKTLKQEGYTRWANSEPNNEGDDEHCVAIDRQKLYNDEPCHIKLSFFCERKLEARS